jgi:hypothetical protein
VVASAASSTLHIHVSQSHQPWGPYCFYDELDVIRCVFVYLRVIGLVAVSSCSKPRGISAARQLETRRKLQRWADKQFKKSNLGTAIKANPLGGSSHAKGIVLEKVYVESLIGPSNSVANIMNDHLLIYGRLSSTAAVLSLSSLTLPSVSAFVFS